jgi:adenosylcobinamide-phosphate synthase
LPPCSSIQRPRQQHYRQPEQRGGAAIYDGVLETRPALGYGVAPEGDDIRRAWRLVRATTLLWLAVMLLAGALYA